MALSLSSQRRLSGAAEGCTSSRRAHATPAAALLRRRAPRLLVRASAVPNDPARVVPLPGAVWFLDALQDQFYDVHGPSFVIHRAETSADGDSLHKHKPGSKRPLPAPLDPMQAIRHAMRTQPMSMMLLADNVVDVEVEGVEEARPGEAGAGVRSLVWVPPAPVVAPNHTETGMIHVPSEEPEDDEGAEVGRGVWVPGYRGVEGGWWTWVCGVRACGRVGVARNSSWLLGCLNREPLTEVRIHVHQDAVQSSVGVEFGWC